MLDEASLDNILVEQKNRILRLINDGMLSEAQASLDTVRVLWKVTGYSYKYEEISKRIMESIRITPAS